ncbi:MAG: ADP-ribose-binding protein [Desulfuromonas sp.]|nr:MAG: ADP-ribose-binding protein [Desulfuromonas sp.]
MHEIVGDLWQEHSRGAVVAITTNGTLSRSGEALLLQGCAREASVRFPDLSQTLGALIQQHGHHVFDLGRRLVSFPVEENPYQISDLALIERSCEELVALADDKGWVNVVVPRPGCGGGGLPWGDVRPILHKYFDERFHVITKE